MSRGEILFHHHGRFGVKGGVLPDAITAYRVYGTELDPSNGTVVVQDKPVIVFPTCYGGRLDSQDYMIGEGKALGPAKYIIITLALFCNGESSSPSNTPKPYNGPYFPAISYEDNIRAQYGVLTKLGIQKVLCVIGFSMGGQQAYHWAVTYPDFIEKYVVICGSARTSPHNQCFLEGPKSALLASKDFEDGHYTTTPQRGIRAFGRAYSAWAYGQTWFREHKYLHNGLYNDLSGFLREEWELFFLKTWDANDMLALLDTWQTGDVSTDSRVSAQAKGDLKATLSGIKAKGLIMPCKTDLYFPPEDSEIEVEYLNGTGKLVVIDSVWGHMAGGGSNPDDDNFIKTQVIQFLEL